MNNQNPYGSRTIRAPISEAEIYAKTAPVRRKKFLLDFFGIVSLIISIGLFAFTLTADQTIMDKYWLIIGILFLIFPLAACMLLVSSLLYKTVAPSHTAEVVRKMYPAMTPYDPRDYRLIDHYIRTQAAPFARNISTLRNAIVWIICIPTVPWALISLYNFSLGDSESARVFFIAGGGFLAIIIALICLLIWTLGVMKNREYIRVVIAQHLTSHILNETFELERYDPQRSIHESIIKDARFGHNWILSEGRDYFTGRYKGRRITFSDVKLIQEGSKESAVTFIGQWLICDFGKPVPTELRVIQKRLLSGVRIAGGRSSVETENSSFNKHFKIICNDHESVFFILTPHFMEHIGIAGALGGAISLWFTGNQVHIALSTGKETFAVKDGIKELDNLYLVRNTFRANLRCLTDILDVLFQSDWLN